MEEKKKKKYAEADLVVGGVVGGILKGFSDLVDKLGDLAETGERISKSGSFQRAGSKSGVGGEYAFSVKVGLGDEQVSFGTSQHKKTPPSGGVREPQVDVFEEADSTVIVAEMPGISADDLQVDIHNDVLTLRANRGERTYYKQVRLSVCYAPEQVQASYNNGIVEIRCFKSPNHGSGHGQDRMHDT